ncbi:MAG: RsmE family RNA methyltransferase [Desulfovibrio sp.]
MLQGTEARHLLKVLRTPVGATVRLFDGQGNEGLFELTESSGKKAQLVCLEFTENPQPKSELVVACGWNKSSRRAWLLEKSVELEAAGLIFWQATFSQGKVPAQCKDSWHEKLVQSAKQCGNPYLPTLDVCSGVKGLVAMAADYDKCYLLWENPELDGLISVDDMSEGRILVVVGPEGGISPKEAETFIAGGFSPVSLGQRILRWETAAMHCLGLGFHGRQIALLKK